MSQNYTYPPGSVNPSVAADGSIPPGYDTVVAGIDQTTHVRALTLTNNDLNVAVNAFNLPAPLQVDIEQLLGVAPGATNALAVQISDGSVYIDPRQIRLLTSTDVVSAVQSGTWNINNITGTISLPTGASTSANQVTANTSLASIVTNTGNIPTNGQKVSASSLPVVVASDQSAIPVKASTPTALTITQAAITVGTTAVRLTVSGSVPSATRVVLAANPDSASAANFYIGSSSVTSSGATRGIQIVAGQSFVANNDAGDYYIVSDTAGQIVEVMEQA